MTKLIKEFKRWLKARYKKPSMDKSKDLCDKIKYKLKIIEDLIDNE